AGVDDGEEPAVPVGLGVVAIPGDAREVLDQRLATAREPIEERGFAHVRASHDGDHRHYSYPSFFRPAADSLQRGSTFTNSDRYTCVPSIRSIDLRASLPIVLSIWPRLPITIAFWLSRSTWMDAAIRTRPPSRPGSTGAEGSRSDSSK